MSLLAELRGRTRALFEQARRIDRAGDEQRRRAEALVVSAEKTLVAAQDALARAERLDALEDDAMLALHAELLSATTACAPVPA